MALQQALDETGIHKILTNDLYIGVTNFGVTRTGLQKHKPADPIKVADPHRGLVPREEFDQVQRLMAERAPDRTPLNTQPSDYLLADSILCAHCGAPFIGQHTRHGKYRYDQCPSKNKLGAKGCIARQLPKEETEAAVIDLLRRDVLSPRYLRELRDLVNAEADTGSPATQRTFLRAWIARIEADGMNLTVTFTLPGDLAGNAANNGTFGGATESLRPVSNGDGVGTGGKTTRMGVTVKTRWASC